MASNVTQVADSHSLALALALALETLRHSFIAQFLLTVLAICVCTRFLSSHWFQSVKYGSGRNVTPPTLPYWIPGLRHALSMAYDSKAFLAKCLNKYGDGSPFFLDGAGQKMLIVLDPEHVKGVLNSSQDLDPNPFIHDKIMGALMASPQAAIDYYNSEDSNTDHIQTTHIRQHTTGSNLGMLDKRLFDTLKASIEESMKTTARDEWKEIPDLFAFLQHHVTHAIATTLLGSSLIASYPGIVDDLWIHIEATDQFFMGLPRFVIPKAYAARDRILSNIGSWTAKSEDLRRQNKVNTTWDPVAGSGLLQEREALYGAMPGHGVEGRSAQTLGLLYGGTSLTVPVTFWYLFETLRNPDLRARVSALIDGHANPESSTYNFMQLTTRPLLQSLHAETTRLYSSNLAVRQVTADVYALDDKYTIAKGTQVFLVNKYSGQFEPGWAQTRPQALTRPLETFWAERFLVSNSAAAEPNEKRERFSDAGLTGTWTSFGGGEHKCPGRHFARNIGIVTLAVFMGDFEVQVAETCDMDHVVPSPRSKAFGTVTPKSRVAARIRRRQGHVSK
ncbi:cytochrome p450 [Stemphylium lycopersici]|nr:cytochrome p450 [Stemphylium lycopersici]